MAATTQGLPTPGLDLRTAFAKKYGVSEYVQLKKRRKSGFTPTLPTTENREKIEEIQRAILLCGFTARELTDFGAYPDPNAKLTNLTNNIHALFDSKNWVTPGNRDKMSVLPIIAHGEEYSLGATPGDWVYQNPVVASIIQPVLRLATRYINNVHTNQLLDDYFFGDFRKLPPEKYQQRSSNDQRYSFHARKPHDRNATETQYALEESVKFLRSCNFTLGFGHPSKELCPGRSYPGSWNGLTFFTRNGSIKITLNIDRYQPLLRNDLSASERYREECFCAKTLLHEFMHALHRTGSHTRPQRFPHYAGPEPFWESQILSELGFAMESSIYDGILLAFVGRDRFITGDKRQNYPRLGTWIISWPPSDKITISLNTAMLKNSKRPDFDIYRPIPSKFYENIKSDEFWAVIVRKYGNPATSPHSIVHVTANHGDSGPPTKFTSPVSSGKLPIWETDDMTKVLERRRGPRTDAIREVLSLTPDEKGEQKIELQLRLNDAHLRERKMFLDGESDFAYEHRLIWEKVRSSGTAGNNDDRDTTRGKLKDLLKCLEEEAERQSTEIARFMLRNDQDKDHRTYLEERNYIVRAMAQTFKQDHADKIQDKDITNAANRLIERLNVCLMMLHEENITPNLLQASFYDQTKAKMTPDTIKSRISLQPFAGRDDPAVRKRLLAEAYLAMESKDATKCKTQAKIFLDHFAKLPFFCAVAQILMSYDGDPEHKNVIEYMDVPERDSLLSVDNGICSDKERDDWHKAYKARVVELEAERKPKGIATYAQVVDCGARGIDSSKNLAALMNKVHLGKFGP